jgi:hypothetical protein
MVDKWAQHIPSYLCFWTKPLCYQAFHNSVRSPELAIYWSKRPNCIMRTWSTNPMTFPIPDGSLSVGTKLLNTLECKTSTVQGNTLANTKAGTALSKVSIMPWRSSPFYRSPKGSPKAMSEIVSRATYEMILLKSAGLYSVSVERYLVSSSLTSWAMFWSTDCSRWSFSLPEY